MRVLLILGDAAGRTVGLLRRELAAVDVVEVLDGAAFEAALRAGEFDASLIRLGLSWGDGAALAREAKHCFPDRPVLLIAGEGEKDEALALAALREGVDDYVVASPRRLRRLPAALAAALERTRALRAVSRAEAALRESEQKLRLVAGQLPCHVWTTDADLRVTSVAGAAFAAIGLDPAGYVGRRLSDITRDEEPLRAHAGALAGRTVRYRRAITGRVFEAHVQPLHSEGGEIVGCLGLALDVTEREEAERREDARHAVSRTLAEAVDLEAAAPEILRAIGEPFGWDYGGLWVVGWEENVLRCVATWRRAAEGKKGPSRFEEISRRTTFEPGAGLPGTVWASSRARWITNTAKAAYPRLRKAQGDGLRSGFAVPVRVGGQTVGVLEFLGHEIRRRDGAQVTAVTSLATQIGAFIERKRTERLSELDRLRKGFVQTVSHDLRTPLTAAKAGLGLLTARLAGRLDPAEARLADTVGRNVQRLEALVDDLLALNQLEAGTLELSPRVLDLRTVIQDAAPAMRPLLLEKEQTIAVDAPDRLPCSGDARQLVRVVGHLLYNAHHRGPRGSIVRVAGSASCAEVCLTVHDTGPGMPPEELERALGTGHAPLESEGASGLGLTVARRIVELHGGRVWAESRPGDGAAFHVALPRHA